PASADGTWGETPWESRSPPDIAIDEAPAKGASSRWRTLRRMAPPRPDRPSRRRAGGDQGQQKRGRPSREAQPSKRAKRTNQAQPSQPRRGSGGRPSKGDAAPKRWGGVARKGARRLDEPRGGEAARRPERPLPGGAPPEWEPEVWRQEPDEAGPVR